ncbi:hypothetical protein BY458DRAFT_446757 [Sporodiniella umbellata]|nr:hypothetical protein BY458DRAFT_446757 [Sporodiniella umbellata]
MNKGPQQLENSFESQHEGVKEILECSSPSKEEEYIPLKPVLQKEKESVSVKNSQLTMHKKAFRHVLFKPPLLQTADDLAKMTPLQAIHISRLQLKISSLLGPLVSLVLEPTALQKTIPHDIRIDYVPGHSIRDRMILFQDYYDIDECFNYLTQNVVFTGGDIRIVKNWSITDPDFSSKFWFISHEFIDQSSIYHLMKSVDGDLANFTESSIS